jgi:prevent-host-death family protein
VTTCDYITGVKPKTTIRYPRPASRPLALKEALVLPEVGLAIPVRAAKAKFSALLEMVAAGREVTVTSDGQPKALLVPVDARRSRKVFTGTLDRLRKLPLQTDGPMAEEIIRADRDGRGW